MGLFSSMHVAERGLSAAQLGMDVTSQNISNADVEGYSRKRLNQSADYRYDEKFGQMGFGVEVNSIERLRNKFIDEQINRQNQELGNHSELDHTLERIENIFTEPGDEGLMETIDEFFNSWDNLANNPENLSARTMVKSNASILTDGFHNISTELSDLKQTRNDEIKSRVSDINKILKEIFQLNKEIGLVETKDQNANDSRDRRDLILKRLSKIIDVDVTENEIGQITVTTAGNILVSPVDAQQLETTTSTFTNPDGTSYSNIGVRFANSKKEFEPKNGELKGLFVSRDEIVPRYQEKVDDLAVSLTEQINSVHREGYNLMGYSGFNFFSPEVTGGSDIEISASVDEDVQNIAAASGGEVSTATPPDVINTTVGASPPPSLSHRNILEDSLTVTDNASGTTLTQGVDYTVDEVMGQFHLINNTYDGHDLTVEYEYETGGFAGPGDNGNAVKISDLRNQLTMESDGLGNPTNTFSQYYSSVMGELGLERNEAEVELNSRQKLIDQFQEHQDSIAGVSIDEEMANLIKFQHTYQASARVISTSDRMLEVLMNM